MVALPAFLADEEENRAERARTIASAASNRRRSTTDAKASRARSHTAAGRL